MAVNTYPGKDVVVEVDVEGGTPTAVDGILSVSIKESADSIRSDAAGDSTKKFVSGKKDWTGSISMRKDSAQVKQQTMRAGVMLDINVYIEGNTSGLEKLSGTVLLTGRSTDTDHDGIAGISYDFQGTGDLTLGAVA